MYSWTLLFTLNSFHYLHILRKQTVFHCSAWTSSIYINSSFSNSSNNTATGDWIQHVDKIPVSLSWDFSFSENSSFAFFLVFLPCALISFISNGLLFFLTVRFKQLLWQPHYILVKNLSASGFGITFVTTLVVLPSVVRKQTQIYGCWCTVQFCLLRCFFLTSQMTLALMAIERYIFICKGIHYLRMVNSDNVHISLGIIWLVSVAVSFQGGLVLSQSLASSSKPAGSYAVLLPSRNTSHSPWKGT